MSKFTIEFEMGNYKKSYEKLYDKDIKEILNSIKYYKKGSDEYFVIVFGDKNNDRNTKKNKLFRNLLKKYISISI